MLTHEITIIFQKENFVTFFILQNKVDKLYYSTDTFTMYLIQEITQDVTCAFCSKFRSLQCLHSDIPAFLGSNHSRILFPLLTSFPLTSFFLAQGSIASNFL